MRAFRAPKTCRQMVELVTDYLEGSLSPRHRRRFESHLSGCDHCVEFLQQMRVTIALTGRITVDDLSPTQQSQLTAMFLRWSSEPS